MLRVALTGGIGSGKTTASRYFAEFGIPVVDADEVSRELTRKGEPGFAAIVGTFGAEILGADGEIDRARLRERAFANAEIRHQLETRLHPLIAERINFALDRWSTEHTVALASIPLLLERQLPIEFDRILVVDCDPELQFRRTSARDGSSGDVIRNIMAVQCSRSRRLAAADDVLENDGDLPTLRLRVQELALRYKRMAESRGG